jgi:hypothetical protein
MKGEEKIVFECFEEEATRKFPVFQPGQITPLSFRS